MSENPASWQPDPTGKHDHRYWDGSQWTDDVADVGVAGTDPYEPVTEETASPDAPTVVTPVPADDTSTYPTSAPPPPYPPPAYVPPSPVATGGPGPAAGPSKRGLVIGGAILAAVVLAVIAIFAIGGDDDDEPTEPLADESTQTTEEDVDEGPAPIDPGQLPDEDIEDVLEELSEEMGLSEEQAECITEALVDAMESGEVDEEEALGEVFGLFEECGISLEDLSGQGER